MTDYVKDDVAQSMVDRLLVSLSLLLSLKIRSTCVIVLDQEPEHSLSEFRWSTVLI